jgi:H+/Cl- antiporter ClcA
MGPLAWSALPAGLTVALASGLAGGLFAKLMIASLSGLSPDRLTPLRRRYPVRFAAGLGLGIALIGLVSHGQTSGGGADVVRDLLTGRAHQAPELFGLLKFIATWLAAWSGVPGGLFAPSLSVGAGIGYNVSSLFGGQFGAAIVAMGMTGFLAAVTQAPLTAFIIVMEMIDGRPMVLSLMAVAMIAATVSRAISRPLYHTLAAAMLAQLRAEQAAPLNDAPAAASPDPSPAAARPAPAAPSPQTPPPAPSP